MNQFCSAAAATAALVLGGFVWAAAPGDTKDEEKAREAYNQFYKAVRAKDLEKVMKVVDRPFLWNGDLTKDTQELRKWLNKAIANIRGKELDEMGIKEVWRYSKFLEKVKEERAKRPGSKARRDFEKKIEALQLTTGDWVILEQPEGLVFIRVRGGKARVAGRLK